MVLSLAPSVFAAEDDAGMSVSFDNTTPNPGDTITALVTVESDFSAAMAYESSFYFDKELLTVEKIEILGAPVLNLTTVDRANTSGRVRFAEFNRNYDETIANDRVRNLKGDFAKITLKVSEYAGGKTATGRTKGMAWNSKHEYVVRWEGSYSLSIQGSETARPTATGYTVSMATDRTFAVGETASIPVTVASSEKKITGFNAYDMTFTYNPAALTLNTASDAAANLTVEDDNNGTVRVRRYGETAPLGEALTLDFTAKNGATSTVTLTGAKFDLDANSINFDAPDATITDAATVVNANNFTVTLPDDFTSDAETRLVPAGGSFTFKPVDSHYDYVFTVKVGDTVTEGQTFGEGGTYTVSDVNANVEVTVTSKTPKQYDVTYKYTRDNVTVDTMDEVIVGPAKATYNEDYSFSIRPRSDTVYSVRVILGEGKSSDDEKFPKKTSNADGTMSFTLDKYYVKQKFRVYVEATSGKSCDVEFKGNGAEDVDPSASNVVGQLNPYYFKLNKRQNCDYTITAIYRPHGGMLAVSRKMNVIETSDGQYMIPAPESLLNSDRWTLEITITKVSHNAEEVDVTTYLNLDGKTMMLVTVKGTPENGSAFTYDGNTMYKVEGYGTDWYAWLVILEKDQTLTKEDAAAKVAVSAADNVITIAKDGFDVNMTGVVDINDAQLVYDMYNGTYGDFGKVTMEKFLRADVNASKNVNSADAVAIVRQFK